MAIDQFGDQVPAGAVSVLDVPFSGATLAINSPREDAFSGRDIAILGQFAQVLSEAHRRLEDLKNLALQEEHLRQMQRLEAIGVAHEINNPLTSVLGFSERLLHRELDPQVHEYLAILHQEGPRAHQIADQLLQFVRRQRVRLAAPFPHASGAGGASAGGPAIRPGPRAAERGAGPASAAGEGKTGQLSVLPPLWVDQGEMRACWVLLDEHPLPLRAETVETCLADAGICAGVHSGRVEELAALVQQGRHPLGIFPLPQGLLPVHGQDAQVEILVDV